MCFKTKTRTKYGPLFQILEKQPATATERSGEATEHITASGCVDKDGLINLEPLTSAVAVTATTFREESAAVQLPAPPPPEPVAGSSRAIDPRLLLDPFKEGPGPSIRRVEDVIPEDLESDVAIAKLLQAQFDSEYDEQLKREEKHRNKNSCLLYDKEDQVEVPVDSKADWDRFETNEKEEKTIPRVGYKFSTGDGAEFDMKLSNKVFNQLKSHSKKTTKKQHKAADRKENIPTAEMGPRRICYRKQRRPVQVRAVPESITEIRACWSS
ncbi:serine/threonine-protein kinase rio3 [Culex quinquefasciatus]|uniref:Serine/threonine-protein kinase rio3 n=1 Tax=Culex quinquefasciatus TaxID=7176 RepID=B0WXS7_CULQU|nr:serine/threonine-protein kinase rio3 [Culex quinquefasciatus]|eukprot:XP_001862199.1 serine/threonine-protein kinase rio3 [Culex quinquefasciatus]